MVAEEQPHRLRERGALGVAARHVGAGERLARADVGLERGLEGRRVLGEQPPQLGLEVPGAQGAEGVVGQGQVGVRVGDGGARVGQPGRRRADDVGHRVVDREGAAEVDRRRDPQPDERGRGQRRGEGSRRGRRARAGPAGRDRPARRAAARGPRRCAPSGRRPTWSPTGCRAATPAPGPARAACPTTPQNDAGLRSEPPMSEPSASGTMPAASAHAAPPLDPPAEREGSTGLRVTPKTVLKVWEPAANSGTLVLPTKTAPARRTRSTSSSSWSATWSARTGEPKVCGQPSSAWVSFTANGRPCSGPVGSPEACAWSATAAAARGPLGVERDDRVELGVALLDPVEVQLEQLARRDTRRHGRLPPARERSSRP